MAKEINFLNIIVCFIYRFITQEIGENIDYTIDLILILGLAGYIFFVS